MPEDAPVPLTGVFPVLDGDFAAHYNILDPFRELDRVLVGRHIDHPVRVEDCDVRGEAGPQDAPVEEAESLSRRRGHLPNRLLEPKDALADIPANDPWEAPVGAGVGPPEDYAVRADHLKRRSHYGPDVVLVHREADHGCGVLLLQHDV